MLLSVVVLAAASGEPCSATQPCADGVCLFGACRVDCEPGLCAPDACVMLGSSAGPKLVPTCTFRRPAADDLKCNADSSCVPLPSEAHTHSCVNKASPAAAFTPPEVVTTLYDPGAAYRAEDCTCFRGYCVDKKDSAVAAAMAASAVWVARPEARAYQARVAVSCFCPVQDYNITVAGGEVATAWDNSASKAVDPAALPARARGVDATFDEIARVLASTTVLGGIQMMATTKYSPAGYPESAAFWPDPKRTGPIADVDWSVRFSDVRSAYPAACLLPQEVGRCRGAFPRWGYSAEAGRCTEFVYGGCGGNLNRFDDAAACDAACAGAGVAQGAVSAATGGARGVPAVGFVLGGVAALLLVGAALAAVYIFVVKRRPPRASFAADHAADAAAASVYVTCMAPEVVAEKAAPIVPDDAKAVN